MGNSLGEVIKKMAVRAYDVKAPSAVLFGKVTNVNPLEITVEQKLKLTKEFLVLTKNVEDYTAEVSVNWLTDNSSIDSTSHNHYIKGKKQITIHNGLKINDNVILLQQQGGNNFVVLDRF